MALAERFDNGNISCGGFTLSELLVVVAVIAVLAAIAIPVLSSQLDKARESVALANARSAYAAASTEMLTSGSCVQALKDAGCDTPPTWYEGDVAYLALKSSEDAPANEFAKKIDEAAEKSMSWHLVRRGESEAKWNMRG